jgi:cell division protease FtsH
MSDETAKAIDEEIKEFVDRNYQRAEKILKDNIDILHAMKDALMHYETIDANQIDDLMERREVRVPADYDDKNSGSQDEPPKKPAGPKVESDMTNPSDIPAK